MPCEVCGAWPTWYDLSECQDAKCPWLDLGKPIPPLPKELRDAPLYEPISPPEMVEPPPVVSGPELVTIQVDSAPVHSHAAVQAASVDATPVQTPAQTPPQAPTPTPALTPAQAPVSNAPVARAAPVQ